MALRTLLPWPWRRRKSAPAPPRAIPVGRVSVHITPDLAHLESLAKGTTEVPLPTRTPGLSTARRHAWEGARHGRGALAATRAWADTHHDPTRGSEADVQHTAALHQIDTALDSLARARKALDAIDERNRR